METRTVGHGVREEWIQLNNLDTLKSKYPFI